MSNNPVNIFNSTVFSETGWDVHYPHLLKVYHFTFRTPEQASDVASHIALYCDLKNRYLELGLNEIFLNAIEHGNLGMTDFEKSHFKNMTAWQEKIYKKLQEPKNRHKNVNVTVEVTSAYISFEIRDQGEGFSWETLDYTHPKPRKLTGRGLLLASKLCFDKVEFVGKGNIIRCICWT